MEIDDTFTQVIIFDCNNSKRWWAEIFSNDDLKARLFSLLERFVLEDKTQQKQELWWEKRTYISRKPYLHKQYEFNSAKVLNTIYF